MIFVNSMSDLFHEDVPTSYIAQVGHVMERASQHTYQVLTKRHERLRELVSGELSWMGKLPQVWLGVSVENRRAGLPRLEALRATPALTRFLSVEPLLEDLGEIDLDGIHWVIVGGESGPSARPIREEWVLNILEQCRLQAVPFFFKQWGGRRKHETGRSLQGRTFDEFPVTFHTVA